MIAEAVAETALVSQESGRNDVFLRLMQQFEPLWRCFRQLADSDTRHTYFKTLGHDAQLS